MAAARRSEEEAVDALIKAARLTTRVAVIELIGRAQGMHAPVDRVVQHLDRVGEQVAGARDRAGVLGQDRHGERRHEHGAREQERVAEEKRGEGDPRGPAHQPERPATERPGDPHPRAVLPA